MSLRQVISDSFKLVPSLFGGRSLGPVSMDLEEANQVYSIRDAHLRATMQRRQFVLVNAHGAAGEINTTGLDLWSAATWTAITTGTPVPPDHDALIVGMGFYNSGGADIINVAILHLSQLTNVAGVPSNLILAAARIGAVAAVLMMDNMVCPFRPYPLQRTTGSTLGFWSSANAITNLSFSLDVISAPIGVLPFA